MNLGWEALLEPAYFNPEDGSTTVLSNIGIPLQNYMTAQPRRPKFIFFYRIINLHFLNKISATQKSCRTGSVQHEINRHV
jgi:hypothetical protein